MIKLTGTGLLFDFDKVLAQDQDKRTDGGIIIPDIAKETTGNLIPASVHEVIGVGDKVVNIKEGDKVILNSGSRGMPLVIDKETKYVIYQEFDVIATL